MRIAKRAIFCGVVVVLLMTVLLISLSFARFNALQERMIQGRLSVVGTAIRDAFQGAVDLGIKVDEVRSADELIRRALAADWNIAAIDVVSPSGRVLYSSGNVGAAPTAGAPRAQSTSVAAPGTASPSRATLVSRVPIKNSLGQTVATVALTYDGAVIIAERIALARNLAFQVALVLAASIGLMVTGVLFVVRVGAGGESPAAARMPGDVAMLVEKAQRKADDVDHFLDAAEAPALARAPP